VRMEVGSLVSVRLLIWNWNGRCVREVYVWVSVVEVRDCGCWTCTDECGDICDKESARAGGGGEDVDGWIGVGDRSLRSWF